MREIDASSGGGQLFRSSLALAALTQTPVRISAIRDNRPNPGLKHQHLAALDALATVCDADVEGAALDSRTVTFRPNQPTGGTVEVDVETAGSITLVFETLVSLATAIEKPLTVTVSGGTDVKWSPPLSTYQQVTLPLYRENGLAVAVERHRTGFYPAGGGNATLHLAPSELSPIHYTERGALVSAEVYSRESRSLAESDVAARQAETAWERLEAAGVGVTETVTATAETKSPGSAVSIVLKYEHTRAGFDAIGERGKPAEDVAGDAVDRALAFHDGTATVDAHVADQLLLPLALAGGQVRLPALTDHVETSIALLEQFGYAVAVDQSEDCPVVNIE